MKLIRDVRKAECPWLDTDLPAGTEVLRFVGSTYGVVGAGVAVSMVEGEYPFFEVPQDAVAP